MVENPRNGDLVKWWYTDPEDSDRDGLRHGTIDVVDTDEDRCLCRVISSDGEVINKLSDEITKYDRYINVYEVERCYGGAEEGGWWYDAGVPIASIPFDNEHDSQRIRKEMTDKYVEPRRRTNAGGRLGRYSVIGDADIEIYSEDGFAEAFPRESPRYE